MNPNFPAILFLAACLADVDAQALRELADVRGVTIGCAYKEGSQGNRPPAYYNTLAREFNGTVGENNMKWDALQNTRGVFTFAAADTMIGFAERNDMKTRGHVFIYHHQGGFASTMPAQATVKATRDTMFKVMKTHITTVMRHFKGKIHEWDIVNEAVARDSSGMRIGTGPNPSFWPLRTDAQNNNWDYVDSAYTYARQADSTAFLMYNDYDCEGMGKKSGLVYGLVSRLKAKKLVDGIGLQCHFYVPGTDTGSNGAWIPSEMIVNLKRLSDLGLRISLTEVDFRIPMPPTAAHLAAQRDAYETLVGICLANPNCKNINIWGLHDSTSWIPTSYPKMGAPLLFDDKFNPKPAYAGVQAALKATPVRTLRTGGRNRRRLEYGHSVFGWNPDFDLRGRALAGIIAYPPGPGRLQSDR
jgi:endo-1,4-beta-xylanase